MGNLCRHGHIDMAATERRSSVFLAGLLSLAGAMAPSS
jgi:hypothetical protein